jgi:hypothetical protein
MAKQKENNDNKAAENQNRLNDALRKNFDILKGIKDLESDSLETYADRLDLSKQLFENAKLIATVEEKISKFSEINSDRAKILTEQYSEYRDLVDEISETFGEVVKNSEKIAESDFEIVDLSKQQNKLVQMRYSLELSRNLIGEQEYAREVALMGVLEDKLGGMNKLNESQKRANDLSQKFLSDTKLTGFAFNNILGKIEHIIDEVGGEGLVGKFFGKKAGAMLEKTKEDIQHKVTQAFQQSGDAGVNAFSLTQMALGSFMKFALPALGVAGLLGLFYGIIHAVGHLDEELAEIGKTFAVNRAEADKIHHIAIDLSKEMKLVGINSGELVESLKTSMSIMNGLSLVKPIKEGNEAASQLVKDVTVLGDKFGLSGDEIEDIHTFATLVRKPIGQIVKESTKLGKGLLTSKQQVAILSKISPSIAVSFKKGTQELIKAAQKAKLLGIELSSVQSFGDGILDFESSLANEMEARVLTGRNINFDLARQYALNNDISSLQDEMLNQLGSMEEFGKLNRIQQQSIAKAFGMEVDEVAKLLAAQEKLNELGIDQAKMDKIQAMNAAELSNEMKKTSNEKLKGYLVTLAKEKESATMNERISDAMKKVKETLVTTLTPLVEQAHHFLDSAEGAEFLKSTVEGIKIIIVGIGSAIKAIGTGISAMNNMFGKTGAAVGIIGAILGGIATYFIGKALIVKGIGLLTAKIMGATTATNALAGSMQAVQSAGSGLGGAGGAGQQLASFGSGITPFAQNAVALGISLIAFAGALWITSKAFQEFAKLDWDQVLGGIGVMAAMAGVAAILTKLGIVMAASGGTIALGLIGLGAALVLFSTSLLVAGKGLELISKINWNGFEGMFTALVKVGASFAILGIASPLIYAGSLALGVASAALWGFSTAMSTLARSLKSIAALGDMKTVATNIASGLKEFASIPKAMNIEHLQKSLRGLTTALTGLNFNQFVLFGQLAKTDMKNAGKNIVEGINSLATVTKDIDFGNSGFLGFGKTGIKASLQTFSDTLSDLNFEGLKAFAEIAKADMSKIGQNINKGIQSLSQIEIGQGTSKSINNAAKSFALLKNAFGQLDFEDVKAFSELNASKLSDVSFKMKDVVFNLSQIGKMGASGLSGLSKIFENLSTAINKLDTSKLSDLSKINVESLQKISSVFNPQVTKSTVKKEETIAVTGTPTTGAQVSTIESESSRTERKLDQMVSLLEKLVGTSKQPAQIVMRLNDRLIDTFLTEIERKRDQKVLNLQGRGNGI